MTNNALFAALYRGFYEAADNNAKLAMLEYVIPVINRWNVQWGDGTLDPFSNRIIKVGKTKEKIFLLGFGRGSKIVYGTYNKDNTVYFCISLLANFDFSLLPDPDMIVERANGRQYYLYKLDDYELNV